MNRAIDLRQNVARDLKGDELTELCAGCHETATMHTHPIGSEHKDPRTGAPLDCMSCHEAHSSEYEYILTFDRTRDLCLQCHASGTMKAH